MQHQCHSDQSKALVVLQDQLHVFLQDLPRLVLWQQQHIEAGMRCWQVGRVRVPLNQEFQRLKPVDRHPICSRDEGEKGFSAFS